MRARHRLSQIRVPMPPSGAVTWLPVLVGIGILTGFMVYGITLRAAGERPAFDPPFGGGYAAVQPQQSATGGPAPEVTAEVTAAPTKPPAGSPATEPPATHPPPAHPPPAAPSPTSAAPPPTSDIVGEYRVEASFPAEFTGQVIITNTSPRPRDWTVTLAFPPNVGELREFWVDGAARPKVRQVDGRYTFTSTVPVEAKSHVVLRVQFDRSGADIDPVVCTVNGAHCLR